VSIEQASQPAQLDVLGWSQPGLPGEASPAQQQVFPGFPVRQSAPRQSNETRAAAQAASGARARLVARLHGMQEARSSNLLSSTMDTMCTGGEGRDPGLNAPTGYLGLKHNWLCTGVASRRVRVRVPPAPLAGRCGFESRQLCSRRLQQCTWRRPVRPNGPAASCSSTGRAPGVKREVAQLGSRASFGTKRTRVQIPPSRLGRQAGPKGQRTATSGLWRSLAQRTCLGDRGSSVRIRSARLGRPDAGAAFKRFAAEARTLVSCGTGVPGSPDGMGGLPFTGCGVRVSVPALEAGG
jgi:hypothetical protein